MTWLVGIVVFFAALVPLVWASYEFGHFLDRKEDDPKFAAARNTVGLWLSSQDKQSFPARVRHANEIFFHWFDALFHGKGTLLEQGLWLGLLFSPLMLVLIRLLLLVMGEQMMPQTSGMLLLAMTLAFALSTAVVTGETFDPLAERYGVVVGVVVGVVLGGVLVVVLGVVLGGVVFGVLGGDFFLGLTYGLGFAAGVTLGSIALLLLRVPLPVHPLRSRATSLVAICLLAVMRPTAAVSFYHLLLQDGPIVLSFLAFNLFADGISLLETRWVLRRSLNLGLLAIGGLVLLDLALSAAIFLSLPLVLGELPSFWESIFFQGSRPWLGILFWSTFSTSALFYLFVGTVMFLVLPGHGLARLFHRTVGRVITIESRPFTAIALGMVLTLAAIAAVGSVGTLAYRFVTG